MVLVGGLGTRLGALTQGAPKPMTPVGGKPFLAYLLSRAHGFGIRRILLLAGYRAEKIMGQLEALKEAAGLGQDDLDIEVMIEPQPLGTGGALRFGAERFDDRFLLLNGDSLFDFDWSDLAALLTPGVQAALALRHEPDASRFGVVQMDQDRVTAFVELGNDRGGLINGGVYALTRQAAFACPYQGSFERDVLPSLAAAGAVRGRRYDGFFLDIGVPDALEAAQTLIPRNFGTSEVSVK